MWHYIGREDIDNERHTHSRLGVGTRLRRDELLLALDRLVAAGALPGGLDRKNVTVEPPRDAAHGDLATNAAMVLAKPAGANPRGLATALAAELERLDEVANVEVAGPGFINLRLTATDGDGDAVRQRGRGSSAPLR